LNIHHLELFYYVARHGGIMEAVRNMPYGIQQPAVSGQILQLEADLGVKLFTRRPFELTQAGKELYAFVQPFFSQIDTVGERLRGGTVHTLRLAAPVFALREHLPELLFDIRSRFPRLRILLQDAHQPTITSLLERQQIDCAITVIEGTLPSPLKSEPLIELGASFVLPKEHKARTADDVLEAILSGAEQSALITLPANEALSRRFREFLSQRGMEWPASIEVSALELIDTYVVNGFGIGLTVTLPGKLPPLGLRYVPVSQMPSIQIGTVWREPQSAAVDALREVVQARAASLMEDPNGKR
jgi:DNA-binding transcriptional LysR family regulator